MSLTIDTLLKSQGEVHLTEIDVHWYFTSQTDEENAIELQGTYNIDSYYDSHVTEIQHPRTHISGYHEIFNKIQFTDIATQSTFILGVNHIAEYELSDDSLSVEFIFHRSIPQVAFNIENPIIAGAADIHSSSENLLMFQSLIHKNLHLHFGDHVFKIPRCTRCSSALTVHNQVDVEDEVINEDFVCMDCYTVINNFYNLLEKEVYKITEYEQMKEQRDLLVKFLITGKKNASQIEETQLQHFYNLLIIYVEYLSGNLDEVNVLKKIQAVQTIGANQNFPLLQQEAENLLNKIDFGQPEEQIQEEPKELEPETWTPPAQSEPESELAPPPLPLGTPSPSTILPQDPELSEGLQSLDEVQAELQSTLEALSMIESDLRPQPITPTDILHSLNRDMEEEESDKIPTFDDIEETFSDLESLDFPDITFGTGTTQSEDSEGDQIVDKIQENIDSQDEYSSLAEDLSQESPSFLNPPPGSTRDYVEVPPPATIETQTPSDPSFTKPTIQTLPKQEDSAPFQPSLNPPSVTNIPEQEFSGTGQVKTLRDLSMGEEGELHGEVKEGATSEVPLNSPTTLQDQNLSPEWRDVSQSTPQPQFNPPPVTIPPPQMNPPPVTVPPPQMNPPPVTVPPPQMNPPPVTVPPPQMNPPLEVEQVPEPPQIAEEPPKPKNHRKPSFFNSNGETNGTATTVQKPIQAKPTPKLRPKQTRESRNRKNKIRRIICSFCGQTMNQGKKKCSNCGSYIS